MRLPIRQDSPFRPASFDATFNRGCFELRSRRSNIENSRITPSAEPGRNVFSAEAHSVGIRCDGSSLISKASLADFGTFASLRESTAGTAAA
jgi:hypothetical protein